MSSSSGLLLLLVAVLILSVVALMTILVALALKRSNHKRSSDEREGFVASSPEQCPYHDILRADGSPHISDRLSFIGGGDGDATTSAPYLQRQEDDRMRLVLSGPSGELRIVKQGDGSTAHVLAANGDASHAGDLHVPELCLGATCVDSRDLGEMLGRRYDRFTGPQGERGPKGYRGARGDTGQRGDTGTRGYRGPKGYTGRRGNRGSRGSVGPKGFYGDTGKKGPDGKPPDKIRCPKPDRYSYYSFNSESDKCLAEAGIYPGFAKYSRRVELY